MIRFRIANYCSSLFSTTYNFRKWQNGCLVTQSLVSRTSLSSDEHVSTQETHALQNPDEHKEVRAEVVVLKISVRDPFHDQLGTQAGKT